MVALQIHEVFNITRTNFPGADVFASTFDNYTQRLVEAAPTLNLPVVTSELGDTWVWGTDAFNTLLRVAVWSHEYDLFFKLETVLSNDFGEHTNMISFLNLRQC